MSTPIDILCAGIVVADHVSSPIAHLPAAGELVPADQLLLTIGGCAANVAVDLGKQEVRAGIVGRVGDDIFGQVVRQMLTERGVDVSGIQVTAGMDTSQTLIVNVVGEDRRFIHSFGANAAFSAGDIPLDLVKQSKILYLGGYFIMDKMVQDELAPVFEAARAADTRTVLDVVIPGEADYLGRLDRLLPHVDVFLPNNDEAAVMLGERDPVRQAERLREMGAGTVIITQGDGGVVLVSDSDRLRAGTFPVDLVDGSGGGDAFSAGYMTGMLRGLPEPDRLRLASALGASCVQAIGTTTGVFTKDECDAFLSSQSLEIESF